MTVDAVLVALRDVIGDIDAGSMRPVGGGSINRSYEVVAPDGASYFLKLNRAELIDMFIAEREGLDELQRADAVRVPRPLASGTTGTSAWLLLEALEFGARDAGAAARLGERLAKQHRVVSEHYGWHRDNTIGSTPQVNERSTDWIEFWRDCRLGFQLNLALDNGLDPSIADRGRQLLEKLPEFFSTYVPEASLLHGDLWGGNWGATTDGEPVIFDPAVYFGDREADIAMTMLFGGFGAEFLAAYRAAWPLDAGFPDRVDLYNLYHVLNHYNLFGGGYEHQAASMLDGLLS